MNPELLLTLYRRMLLVRHFDDRHVELLQKGRFPQAAHAGTGQEAVAIGITAPLGPDDYLFPTHRGVGEYVGKGMAVKDIWAELLGRATGACHGKAGIHLSDARVGIAGLVGSVGTDFSIAVGSALAFRLQGTGRVSCAYFGEGAASSGDLPPALNMAAIWRAPVIFACINNQYAEMGHYRGITPTEDVAPRAGAFGVPYEIVADGNDIEAVYAAMNGAVERARSGGGPAFIEFKSYRLSPHYTGDRAEYQPRDEIAARWENEPLGPCRAALLDRGWATEAELQALEGDVAAEVQAGLSSALAEPEPAPAELFTDCEPLDRWEANDLHG